MLWIGVAAPSCVDFGGGVLRVGLGGCAEVGSSIGVLRVGLGGWRSRVCLHPCRHRARPPARARARRHVPVALRGKTSMFFTLPKGSKTDPTPPDCLL